MITDKRRLSRYRGPWLVLFVVHGLLTVNLSLAEKLPALDCVIAPYQVVDLASPVPGVLDKIYVDRSDFIKQGDVAASLEAGVEHASVVLARARAAIDSEVQVNSVNLDFDKRRKDRMDALYQKKSISIDLKEEAEREQRLSMWRLQQARDLKGIRQLELLRAEEQLQQKTIRTPFSGFVLKRYKGAGEYVEDQPIMRIAQLDPLAVEAVVPIDLHGQLKAGMRAQVYTQGDNGQSYEAQVITIDRAGDAASGTFGVRLTLPNPDYRVLAGVKCLLKFSAGVAHSPVMPGGDNPTALR